MAWLLLSMVLALTPAERADYAESLRELARRDDMVQPDLGIWMKYNRPSMRWDYRHMVYIQERLDAVTAGDVDYLALMVSGRHGKTEHVTSYMAYLLERDPTTSILFATYNTTQAGKIGKAVQDIGRAIGLPIVGSKPAHSLWYVEAGGGLQCLGVGSKSASLNADVIIIDDPIGSRADAESFATRDAVWLWLTTDILARMVTGTRVIFSMPRWHIDDPMGRLLDRQAEMWTVVDMPGRALKDDQLGRAEGELLWPELRGDDFHRAQRITGGAYGYASFIQCRPTIREGGMFEWDWWKLLEDVPADGRMVRYWDLAGTDVNANKRGHDPDYTVGALLCRMADQRTAIVDVERFRHSVAARDARMEEVAREDLARYPGRVRWWIEAETGIAGADRTRALLRRLQVCGMSVHTEHASGNKTLRAEPIASHAEAGNVLLCPGAWRDPFRLEMADFPHGSHDDQADAVGGAYAKLGIRTSAVRRTVRI